ncbi:zinc finger protein NUTCRACKER-like [Triticum dicoccoides]|uniref:zinc finger protein NUTCRACKER-like n=1 Tax=Triticum dicoccoides TaxID=85692 RepID=UPI00188F5CA1|nr:zinc finger protein NUTCRACKER-like [Triticum dicoccoides]
MASEAMPNPFAPLTNQPQQQQPPSHEHPAAPPPKKKRNLPGTPDPDAEVIALSPRTLMATNRFVCEICGKGFQRDQNLQLHRRGHNLPWKLRQRCGKEPRKRVYVCPEKSCVHHNPSRALGDLTGIKKHFCRKHGEKKWKCDKCAKRYAVQSDWKAHSKTCGTREYRCDCGTLFSRRDSFITHRAFCDALAEETARLTAASSGAAVAAVPSMCGGGQGYLFARPNSMMLQPPLTAHLKPAAAGGQILGHAAGAVGDPLCDGAAARHGGLSLWGSDNTLPSSMGHHIGGLLSSGGGGTGAPMPMQMYADLFAPSSGAPPQFDMAQLSWLYGNNGGNGKLSSSNASELTTNSSREADSAPSVFSGQQHAKPAAAPTDMSATALLQRAAQIGSVTSSNTSMPLAGAFEQVPNSAGRIDERSKFDDRALFGASQHNANVPSAMGELSAATGNVPYDVFSAARHAGLKDAVGREETRDFLGVGMQALCSSSINGWI